MRLAISISPSRVSSSTEPISRMYMRTGSVVRPNSLSTVDRAASAASSASSSVAVVVVPPAISSVAASGACSYTAMPMSLSIDTMASRISLSTSFSGRWSLISWCVRKPRVLPILMSVFSSSRRLATSSSVSVVSSRPNSRISARSFARLTFMRSGLALASTSTVPSSATASTSASGSMKSASMSPRSSSSAFLGSALALPLAAGFSALAGLALALAGLASTTAALPAGFAASAAGLAAALGAGFAAAVLALGSVALSAVASVFLAVMRVLSRVIGGDSVWQQGGSASRASHAMPVPAHVNSRRAGMRSVFPGARSDGRRVVHAWSGKLAWTLLKRSPCGGCWP
jgi:hypothetical protein